MKNYSVTVILILILLCLSCTLKVHKQSIQVGFSQAMSSDNWRQEMEKSMQVQSSLYPYVELEIKNADNNVENQIEQIEDFVNAGVDVLIVSPIKSKPVTTAIENVTKAGIPT